MIKDYLRAGYPALMPVNTGTIPDPADPPM